MINVLIIFNHDDLSFEAHFFMLQELLYEITDENMCVKWDHNLENEYWKYIQQT